MESRWHLSWPEWHAAHEQCHLAAYPDLDWVSRDNLRMTTLRSAKP